MIIKKRSARPLLNARMFSAYRGRRPPDLTALPSVSIAAELFAAPAFRCAVGTEASRSAPSTCAESRGRSPPRYAVPKGFSGVGLVVARFTRQRGTRQPSDDDYCSSTLWTVKLFTVHERKPI